MLKRNFKVLGLVCFLSAIIYLTLLLPQWIIFSFIGIGLITLGWHLYDS